MKLQHFILAALLSFAFVACNWLDGEEQEQTPFFYLFERRISADGDTAAFVHIVSRTDTISVGDTIVFRAEMWSNFSPLREFRITPSSSNSIEFVWWAPEDSLNLIFDAEASNYNEGIFVIRGDYYGLTFPFKYVATRAEMNQTLEFRVTNFGAPGLNTTTVTIRTPIRD